MSEVPSQSTPSSVLSSAGFRAIDAFLGVQQSVTGNRWVARQASDDIATQIAAITGLPAPVARALASRQVQPEKVQHFLEPKLRDILLTLRTC